eukprot:6476089-Amphidinium_carterae.2
MGRAGCTAEKIRKTYANYHDGAPTQQRPEPRNALNNMLSRTTTHLKSHHKGQGKSSGCGKGKRRPSIASSTASKLTTRPVTQQFTKHVTITNFYATPGQTFQLLTIDDSNETGTKPIITINNSASVESTT